MEKIKKLIGRISLNSNSIANQVILAVGAIYTIWGFVSLFIPSDSIFDQNTTAWMKLLYGVFVLIGIVMIVFTVSTIITLKATCAKVFTTTKGNSIFVKFGDINSTDIIRKSYEGRYNVVVHVNRCFDTIVDNDLISSKTIHGEVINKLVEGEMFSLDSLNEAINKSLSNETHTQTLERKNKSKGKLERFPCGTIAEIKVSDKKTIFFLGLSRIDGNELEAKTSIQEFTEAIQKMIEYCNKRSQGYPVVIPIMGTGLSRLNISHSDSLNYIISALRINQEKLNCDYYIVAKEDKKDCISIKNL